MDDLPYLLPIAVTVLAFILKFGDSAFGAGYGTILTPILLAFGFTPLQVVPALLFSEGLAGLTAAFFHSRDGNVNFHKHSQDRKIALVLTLFSVAGSLGAVFIAVNLPQQVLKTVIGALIVLVGVVVLVTFRVRPTFSWEKLTLVGIIASVTKGLSGGGYGPMVMGGELAAGIRPRDAIGIAMASEGVMCLVASVAYYFTSPEVDFRLLPWMTLGAVASGPLAALVVHRFREHNTKLVVAALILGLGAYTVWKGLAS